MYQAKEKINEEADKTLGSINRELEENQTLEKARKYSLSYIDVSRLNINPDLFKVISEEQAKEAMLIPFFKIGNKLRVAVYDPNLEVTKALISELKERKYKINICLASKSSLLEVFNRFREHIIGKAEDFNTDIDEENLDVYDKEIGTLIETFKERSHQMSSAELLNLILVGAIKTKSSDIHLEPKKSNLIVRYRIDGMLQMLFTVPKNKISDLINQTKFKAKMKLNVTTRPQDGRFFFVINNREVDVRVSALPTPYGEDIVIRILDSKNKNITLNMLGFDDINKDHVIEAMNKPYGMILTTGPTGSGKTTTLYALIKEVNNSERKVITIEDPIEYQLEGVTQSQISEDENYTFSNGIKSILRQDPDIIMVGEIRDFDTAEAAAQAALTGHKVLSTLHTNDAVGAIDRLVNMGLEGFMIAPSVDTIIAQRLVRKCCKHCAYDVQLKQGQKEVIMPIVERLNTVLKNSIDVPSIIKKAKGCEKCSFTGYSGRVGLYEVIQITDEVREMILQKKSAAMIKHIVRSKSFSVFEAGIIKVIQKETTLEEVIRVSKMNE